jgi:hypothetical protein
VAVAGGQIHNLGTCPFKSSTLEPPAWEQHRQEGQSSMLDVGAILVTHHAAHMARVWCKAGIKCLSHTAKQEGPTQVAQKCGHKFHIGMCNQVERHRTYSGHYSGVFVAPKNTRNAETKRQSGAVPILLLALSASTTSAYSSLGVLQGLNSQRWLLKASVYHLATSELLATVETLKRTSKGCCEGKISKSSLTTSISKEMP